MWPLGNYDRMVFEIKRRENPEIPVTFGVLIADYRQSLSREYILNYIKRFDYKSDKYINFYLPGYLEENFYGTQEKIVLKGKEYYFKYDVYDEFLERLEDEFQIEYSYNPRLILFEYYEGHFKKSKKISIELDSGKLNIKKTGELFERIFNIAKKKVALEDISRSLQRYEMKSGFLDSIVTVLDNKVISLIHDKNENMKVYRII